MKNKTQENWVKERLEINGYITRNECLKNYISRLGAIICDLKKEGFSFKAYFIKNINGLDYKYELESKPEQKQLFKTFNINA
jgi:hypothetical protein